MSTDNFDKDIQDVQAGTNLEDQNQSENTENKTEQDAEPVVDYEVKFKESSKEALRLLEENKTLRAQKATQDAIEATQGQTMESLYPGFEQLSQAEQANILAFSEGLTKKVRDEFNKDPSIAFARKNYNEATWDHGFNAVLAQYPELAESKDEFKTKYFNVNNVPENIDSILMDVAKIYLFDKARSLGAEDEKSRQSRIDTERSTAGDRTVKASRSLEDWNRMAQDNPAKFASMSKEYHADVESGKLKE